MSNSELIFRNSFCFFSGKNELGCLIRADYKKRHKINNFTRCKEKEKILEEEVNK
jgi:hypothetical protein